MNVRALALASFALLLSLAAGCNPSQSGCESICRQLITGCEFTAWSSAEQCQAGCVEDMYRRSDAEDVLACYQAAIDPISRAEAEDRVDRALEKGALGGLTLSDGIDREAVIQQTLEASSCDVFAVVQCKVEAVQVAPSGLFID